MNWPLLHNDYPYYQVYSSVYVEPTKTDEGVVVRSSPQIPSPQPRRPNIRMGMITAGAVGTSRSGLPPWRPSMGRVPWEGPKAFKAQGKDLPAINVEVAQKELEVTAKINEEIRGSRAMTTSY